MAEALFHRIEKCCILQKKSIKSASVYDKVEGAYSQCSGPGVQHSDYQMLVSSTEEHHNTSSLVWDKLQALGMLYNYPTAQPDSSLPDPSLLALSHKPQTVESFLAPCLAAT